MGAAWRQDKDETGERRKEISDIWEQSREIRDREGWLFVDSIIVWRIVVNGYRVVDIGFVVYICVPADIYDYLS